MAFSAGLLLTAQAFADPAAVTAEGGSDDARAQRVDADPWDPAAIIPTPGDEGTSPEDVRAGCTVGLFGAPQRLAAIHYEWIWMKAATEESGSIDNGGRFDWRLVRFDVTFAASKDTPPSCRASAS